MNFDTSEEQELLQQTVAQFLEGECPPARLREIFDGDAGHDPALWQGMVELGLAGLAIPEAHGGAGLEAIDLALVAETLGYGAAPGPFLGQTHHFVKFNPGKSAYAEERYTREAKRLWGVLDRRLGETEYVAGDYSIADIAIWPWISRFQWQAVNFADYPNVKRWYVAIAARPAVQRGWNVPPRDGGIPMP